MNSALKNYATYVNNKIDVCEISLNQYISTDNILQNKQGIECAASLPIQGGKVTAFKKGDILLANIRPYLKKIWYAQFDGGCSADVLAIRANAKIDSHFLFYALFRDDFFIHAMKGSKGTKMPRGDKSQIMEFKIPVFNPKTQQSIAAVLSALDKKIALNKQINARLEEMAKTLYDYWFVQFDFPDTNGKPYKSSGGEMVFDETLKREIPNGWEVKSLGEIENNIITGKTPSTQYSNFFNGDIPFITIGDIRNNTFIIKTEQNLSIEGANNQKNKYLPEGSLCVSCIATVGLIGFTTRQAQTNQQINSIIFKHDYNKEFLYFYLKDYFLVGKAKTGNTFANMNKGDFEKILVLYPNLKLLQKYSNKMVLVFNQINNLSKQNHQLTQLRDFLLPMLMNGQVSVAE
ncbi:restriction endonuclease subunit S [uncultured Neisseria sp.]|uniref:restriction endonuclease subunit S n=1 Tax=uncultured Neisseria sp. TaxID=237778 RepID=UPI0025F043A0|nr:restriction endonuclease subunit S [uncultured Neisseria sp.]